MDKVYPNRTETPPVDDPDMWARVFNALYFLERDGEFEWLRDVRATVCREGDERTRETRAA